NRRPLEKYIGVLSIEGMITPGVSRKPPFSIPLPIPFMGSETAGDESVLQLMRLAERDRQMAALVLYIDSPGGVHLSSDLIWRQIDRFSKKKPVVCVFGDVAASGGYYIGASATHIVAPELGITGSIGVYTAHVSARDLYEKLNIKRVVISRGQRSLLRSDVEPLDDEKREVLWNTISHVYDQFKTVVAKGRKKDIEQLEEVSGGRVWTGSQALNRGLVDSHGDMQDGLIIAAELAGLPIDEQHEVEAVNIYSRRDSYILPRAYEQVNDLTTSLSIDNILIYFNRPMTMLPFDIRIR
ncbi:MAG: signal peptide peptidase SppA, partial [Candidatus Promineifilaceae bacterium]